MWKHFHLLLKRIVRRFIHNERSATLVEYTILLGVITGAVIILISFAGDWVNSTWQDLLAAIQPSDPACHLPDPPPHCNPPGHEK